MISVSKVSYPDVIYNDISAAVDRKPPPGKRWVLIHLKVTNATDQQQSAPNLSIRCDAGSGSRYVYAPTGALDLSKAPVAKSSAEGDVVYAEPADGGGCLLVGKALGTFADSRAAQVVTWKLK